MKRIIITGATGFIGANLTRRLLLQEHDVHILVRQKHASWRIDSLKPKLNIHEVDFMDKVALTSVIGEIKPDWVLHLAVYGAYSWQNNLSIMIQTNILSTINLIESCLDVGFGAFINTGTSSEYGFKSNPHKEEDALDPNSFYAVTKASASLFCRYVAQSRKANIVTLRLYSAYGPFEDPNRLVPTLILEGLNGSLPKLVSPEASHDFIYIEDVVDAYLHAAESANQLPGAIYNVGTGKQIYLRDVVEIVRKTLKIEAEPKWSTMSNRIWDTNAWVADNRKLREGLSWQPRHSFEEGFKKTLAWFLENPQIIKIYRELLTKQLPR